MRMQYLFLRHAETEVTARKEWHGTTNAPLSLKGRQHALTAAERLNDQNHKITVIITSDFSRAVETATLFAKVLNCSVKQNPLLRERHLGEWEGLTRAEIEKRWPGLMEAWRIGKICGPPGGETDAEVATRVARALSEYANRDSDLMLVISHAGLLRGLLACEGMPDEEIPPLSGRWISLAERNKRISIGKVTVL
jgi:broad specificity phosphatase PhoE